MSHLALVAEAPSEPSVGRLRRVHLGMIDAVLAGEGPESVARIAAEELHGHVLVSLPGAGLQGPKPAAPLLAEVPVRSGGELLGTVALYAGRAISGEDEPILHLAALAVLTAVTLAGGADEPSLRSRSSLLRDLRLDPPPPVDELTARARRLGCDLAHGAVALVAAAPEGTAQRSLAAVLEHFPSALVHARDGRLEGLLPGDVSAAARHLRLSGPIGLSTYEPRPELLHQALREADLVLGLAIAGHEDLDSGAWSLLIRSAVLAPAELGRIVATSVGPVAEHDRRTRGDLLRTLRIYMEREGNMRATADASFAHRHTVASRLDRIHELTGHDPRRPAGQEALGLGLKALAVREAGPGH